MNTSNSSVIRLPDVTTSGREMERGAGKTLVQVSITMIKAHLQAGLRKRWLFLPLQNMWLQHLQINGLSGYLSAKAGSCQIPSRL